MEDESVDSALNSSVVSASSRGTLLERASSIKKIDPKHEVELCNNETEALLKKRRNVFILFSVLQIFVNYDVGAMAIVINQIEKPYDFSSTDLGILCSLTYCGLIVCSPFIGSIFTVFDVQWLISIGLVLNSLSLLLYVFANRKILFFISRFLVGATQSFFIIYAPVWVGCFAPVANRNIWMAILQGSIVTGVMIGYSGTALYLYAGEYGWRYSFATQAAIILLLDYLFFVSPTGFISLGPNASTNLVSDVKISSTETDHRLQSKSAPIEKTMDLLTVGTKNDDGNKKSRSKSLCSNLSSLSICGFTNLQQNFARDSCLNNINCGRDIDIDPNCGKSSRYRYYCSPQCCDDSDYIIPSSIFKCVREIITKPTFCFSTITISVLYYTLTAIHYWMTKLFLSMFDITENMVYLNFTIVSISAPVLGVLFGSVIIDKITQKFLRSSVIVDAVLFFWAVLCVILGISAVIWVNYFNLIISVWFILFFGGCILPPLTLISISTVQEPLRAMASSLCMCLYHIFGYIGGTVIPGVVMDIYNNDISALYATFLPTILGAFAILGILSVDYLLQKQYDRLSEIDELGLSDNRTISNDQRV